MSTDRSPTGRKDLEILEKFVASFAAYDDMRAMEWDQAALSLAGGSQDEYGVRRWQPRRVQTEVVALDTLYSKLPFRLPRLFEHLVLNYRWAEVDLGKFTLLANPPGEGLAGLYSAMSSDSHLWSHLTRSGYVRFAKGPGGNYDAVCFATRLRRKSGECPIVAIDHEEILCNDRVKVVGELATSFRELATTTIQGAEDFARSAAR